MTENDYLKMLVEEIHSSVVATVGDDGLPETRVIDMMLWDENGVYFLTAKGKTFYSRLMEQKFIALSASKGKISISLRGKIKSIGSEKLDEIFEKNPYMKSLYPGDTKAALEVFCIYEASGEYFDISVPSHVVRDSFFIGNVKESVRGYKIVNTCTGCKKCIAVCPQKCIDFSAVPAVIDVHRCLNCGRCAEYCPTNSVERRC